MISAVVNTLNEAGNIAYCLESLRWCDEIIVVDMESDDETVAIAGNYADRIMTVPRCGYVEPARKAGVDAASGDWILVMDADEVVPLSLARKLRQIAESAKYDAVEIPVKNFIMGEWIRHTGWGDAYWLRFFRKSAVFFSDVIHHGINPAGTALVVRLEPTDEHWLYHFNYLDSEHFVTKLNRYTNFEVDSLLRRGVTFSVTGMLYAGAHEFYSRYVRQRGYRDGRHGLVLSLLMAFYRFLSHIKLWERHLWSSRPVQAEYDAIRRELLEMHRRERLAGSGKNG